MSRRRMDWPERLRHYIEMTKDKEFDRAAGHDCALWAAGAIDAMCGTSLVVSLAADYTNAQGAMNFLRARGWKNCGEAVERLTHTPPDQNASSMVRGDIVFIPASSRVTDFEGGALAVCYGDKIYFPGPKGLKAFSAELMQKKIEGMVVYHV